MDNQVRPRRYWPLAVTVSLVLHGVAVLLLGMLPTREIVQARPSGQGGPLPFDLVELDSGEVTFEAARPEQKKAPSAKKNGPPLPAHEPLAAILIEPGMLDSGPTLAADVQGSPAGPSGNSAHATTSFFQVEARGQRLVYVVDSSSSMGKKGALARACQELQQSIRRLPPTARFQVIVYNDTAHFLLRHTSGWLEPTPANIQQVVEALGRQLPEGRTDHEPALRKAFLLDPDVVFFLTDADDLEGKHLRLASGLNRRGAVVHTIELNIQNRQRPGMPLQQLARDNRGVYRAVDLDQ